MTETIPHILTARWQQERREWGGLSPSLSSRLRYCSQHKTSNQLTLTTRAAYLSTGSTTLAAGAAAGGPSLTTGGAATSAICYVLITRLKTRKTCVKNKVASSNSSRQPQTTCTYYCGELETDISSFDFAILVFISFTTVQRSLNGYCIQISH